jgi:hypothetical protein
MRSFVSSGVEELLDLSPIASNDVVRADVSAPLEGLQGGSGDFRKFLTSVIWHI